MSTSLQTKLRPVRAVSQFKAGFICHTRTSQGKKIGRGRPVKDHETIMMGVSRTGPKAVRQALRSGRPRGERRVRRSVSRVLSPFLADFPARNDRWLFIWGPCRHAPHATHPDDSAKTRLSLSAQGGLERPSLLGLAPGGVYHARPVAGAAVRSYRTLSPLPDRFPRVRGRSELPGGLLSVALSLGFPPPEVIRHRVFVEPGLSSGRMVSQARPAAIQPSDPALM